MVLTMLVHPNLLGGKNILGIFPMQTQDRKEVNMTIPEITCVSGLPGRQSCMPPVIPTVTPLSVAFFYPSFSGRHIISIMALLT